MRALQTCFLIVSLLAVGACHDPGVSKRDTDSRRRSSRTDTVSVDAAAPSYDRLTGAVSEEEFKSLHDNLSTDTPVTRGSMIELDGTRAYMSLPEAMEAPLPGIVLMHEWWGLNAHIMHWADRLASEGYAVVAVDLYGGVVATDPEQANNAMKHVDDAHALRTMKAALAFLRADPRIRASRAASLGWCFGGLQSLRLALAAPDLDACVMYYGSPITEPAELAPLQAELLGIFGTRDKSIPPERVKQFEAALQSAGKTFTIKSYDAEHAFANPSNARYDEASAAAAWSEVRAFLQKRLKR